MDSMENRPRQFSSARTFDASKAHVSETGRWEPATTRRSATTAASRHPLYSVRDGAPHMRLNASHISRAGVRQIVHATTKSQRDERIRRTERLSLDLLLCPALPYRKATAAAVAASQYNTRTIPPLPFRPLHLSPPADQSSRLVSILPIPSRPIPRYAPAKAHRQGKQASSRKSQCQRRRTWISKKKKGSRSSTSSASKTDRQREREIK